MRKTKRPRTALAHVFPPAPSWPRDEAALLTETDPPLSLLLWQRARDARLWALAGQGSRVNLFTGLEHVESAMEVGERVTEALATPLRTLRALVRFPELVTAADVCAACLAISEWAQGEHMPETSLHYAEAAALADPTSARAAAVAGAACTAQAADQRAEVWLTRAVVTARRTKAWEWHARAYLRLGALYYELGDTRKARRAHNRARASASTSGHMTFAGNAHHNLLLVECAAGTFRAGAQHARMALELYPHRFAYLPHLAHDVAYLLTCHGAYADALALLDAALPFFNKPWERMAALGTVAKAAGGTGRRERHSEAVADVLLLQSVAETHAACSMVLAAEGAALLGERDRAQLLASRALELAERRREREAQRRARHVLDGADGRPKVPPPADEVASLRALFVNRLRERRAATGEPHTHVELRQVTTAQ